MALILIFSVLTKRLDGKSISDMTYLVLNLNLINQLVQQMFCSRDIWS